MSRDQHRRSARWPVADRASAVQLDPKLLQDVVAILRRHGVGAANRPLVFGSRATGDARPYSDLDIALAGDPLPLVELGELQADLEESDLPIRVDVVNLATAGERLRRQALAVGVPLEEAIANNR